MEIDNATRAQVLREFASATLDDRIAQWLRDTADSIDPPRPQIEPGTLCEAEHVNGGKVAGYYYGDECLHSTPGHRVDTGLLTNIRPVRTLKPTQIAVDVPHPETWPSDAKEYLLHESWRLCDERFTGHARNRVRNMHINEARRMHEEARDEST